MYGTCVKLIKVIEYLQIMVEGKKMDTMSFEELQQIVSVCLDEIIKLKEENAKLKDKLNCQKEVKYDARIFS